MPLGGQSSPFLFPCRCSSISLPRVAVRAVQTKRAGSPCLAQTWFPFCRECRALQSTAPGRGCSFLCFCTSPPSELLRLSGICHVIPQAGTGVICARFCPPRWALALQQRQSSPPSPRLACAPQGPGPHGNRGGSAAGRALPNPACDSQRETLPQKAAIARHHREQNARGCTHTLSTELHCKDPDRFLPSTLVVTGNTV